MNGTMRHSALVAVSLFLALVLFACEKIDRNMWDNPAFGPQSPPVRTPPEGSVPTKGLSHRPAMQAAASLSNPVAGSALDVEGGKALFTVYCVPCHGVSGKGDGAVGRKFSPTPSNIGPGGITRSMSDGEIYTVVSNGEGLMPSFAADISPVERWRIVARLRAFK